MRQMIRLLAIGVTALGSAVKADIYAVTLEPATGTPIRIATIETTGTSYALRMAPAPFSDHFLSMRPFKCLEGPGTHWCHVPYPYEIARDLAQDTTDLEYDFLFVWKPATEYGIDLWRGVYFDIVPDGAGYVGTLFETDLDKLGVPPDAGELRPIREADLIEAEPDSFWLPVLRITPE
ncbi:hypothetical protein [Roseivivax sp. CAU 1753]